MGHELSMDMRPMDRESPTLAGLTPAQQEAVGHVEGPLLVLAGPGSGKTRVITRRVAYLVREVGIPPWNILAITFTNKAAGELRDRVGELLSDAQAQAVTVATFHSLCARLIRQNAERLGLPAGYSIYDSADQQRAIKQALEDLEINPKNFPPRGMLAAISNAKNELMDAAAYAQQADDFYKRTVAKVYKKYSQILQRNQAVDFDDLLLKTVQLFRQHPEVLKGYQEKFQYVLIDEYQDTNHAQFMIANSLAAGHGNLCATGDPDQSIYGWRGANIQNILEFESHYPNAAVVRLEQNYRSTQRILAVADALIQQNRTRKHKTLWTENGEGERVRVTTVRDERAEAAWIVERFRELHDRSGVDWGSMAIFYRMNSLSRVLEDALRDHGVPYQIARGTAFYDRKEIKDAVAYLRTIANPADEVNLLRVINLPARGISDKTVKAMQAHSMAHDVAVHELAGDPMAVAGLTSRAQNALVRFTKMLEAWRVEAEMAESQDFLAGLGGGLGSTGQDEAQGGTLAGLVSRVLEESGLEDFYRNDKSDPDQERLANLGELVSFAQQFEEEYVQQQVEGAEEGEGAETEGAEGPVGGPSLGDRLLAFLERISLVSDVDGVSDEEGSVTLMTLHAAKGLEFSAVAVAGLEEGVLPHQRARDDDEQLEEERRLCFVGITRAMEHLFLTHTCMRTIFGQTTPVVPSRFLHELPGEHVEREELVEEGWSGDGVDQRAQAGESGVGGLPVGARVMHPRFGVGKVLSVTPAGAHTRARIDFQSVGSKTIVLQYVQMQVLD